MLKPKKEKKKKKKLFSWYEDIERCKFASIHDDDDELDEKSKCEKEFAAIHF